jgi:hypothetical protein
MRGCRVIVLCAALTFSSIGNGQQFKPYPATRITQAQWASYFKEVRQKLGSSMQELASDNVVVFSDHATQTSYAFTQPGHPAHPAWITRQVVETQGGVGIRQTGYFAGDQASFTAMYQAYQDLNDRIGEFMRHDQKPQRPEESGPPASR